MFKKLGPIFLIYSLVINSAFGGLPPTTSKVTGDSSDLTTFKYQFPNFTGTHTGTTISLGVNAIAGGGTGQTTANPAFNALSPLTTKGDLLSYTTVNARHAAPADYGSLVPDSGATDGWRTITHTQLRTTKNYVQYGDFENNATTGWTATGIATITNGLPITVGSGGTAFSSSNGGRAKGANTNAIAIDSSSAISGTYSMNLATTGAGVIGDGYISSAYTIDKADQAKPLGWSVTFHVASGTPVMGGTSADTYAVAIYDMVNNAWLGSTGAFSFNQSTLVGKASGTFQTASTTTGIQIFIYSPVAPTGTSSLLIDDVSIGPQITGYGAAIGDDVAYTPTFTGFGTPTAISVFSRRVGDSLEGHGVFTTGTNTATEGRISLGYNGVDGVVTSSSALPTISVAGRMEGGAVSATYFGGLVTLMEASKTYITFGVETSTISPLTKKNGNVIDNSTTYSFAYKVPITGWSSNVQMSNDTDTRVVSLNANNNAGSTTANTAISAWTIAKDTHGAFVTGGTYTIPVAGDYIATFTAATTAGTPIAQIYKNGTLFQKGIGSGVRTSVSVLLPGLVAGDLITPRLDSTLTLTSVTTDTVFSINRLSGPSQIAASETVAALYSGTPTGTLNGSYNITTFPTKVKDSHGICASGSCTIPVAGTYHISFYLSIAATFALNNVIDASVFVDGVETYSDQNQLQGAVANGTAKVDVGGLPLTAGQVITVRALTNGTGPVYGGSVLSRFSIERTGNY